MLKWPNSMIAAESDRRTMPTIVNHVAAGNHRFSQVEGAAGGPHRPAVGQDPETAEPHHRGRDRRGKPWAMMAINIFRENHRFSEKTPHPGPHSVVGAANLAASSGGR
jgi:hypothetical protein